MVASPLGAEVEAAFSRIPFRYSSLLFSIADVVPHYERSDGISVFFTNPPHAYAK